MAVTPYHVETVKRWILKRKLRGTDPTERDTKEHIKRTFTWVSAADREEIYKRAMEKT